MSSLTMSKRTMAIGMIAAFAMAIIISMTMTSPAMAASAKKPHPGYQKPDTYYVYDADHNATSVDYMATYGAGSISMENVGDTRNVKQGYEDFTVWSGDNFMMQLSSITENEKNPDGTYTNDWYTYVNNSQSFKKLKGMSYNKKKNTLTLKNVKAPAYKLVINGMGSGFKIVLKGKKNQLAGIQINAIDNTTAIVATNSEGKAYVDYYSASKYLPCSVKIDGTGKLVINKKKYLETPIMVKGGGSVSTWDPAAKKYTGSDSFTKSKLSITKKPHVQIYAYSSFPVVDVYNSAAKKPVSIPGVKKDALDGVSTKIPAKNDYEEDEVKVLEANGEYDWYDLMKLNNGLYYGEPAEDSAWYLDTKTRETYYATWNIYQTTKPSTLVQEDDYWYYTTAEAVLIGQVGNDKDHPKGYTPVVSKTGKAHYDYVIKNSKLVAGK